MDDASRRFSRRVAIQNLFGLGLGIVGSTVVAAVGFADGRADTGVLSLAVAGCCGRLAFVLWPRYRAALVAVREDNDDAQSAGIGSLAPARGPVRPAVEGATVWWYWVLPRLTTTRYSVTDADGEWVGAFDRRGYLGYRARAQNVDYDGFDLALERDGRSSPQAVIRGELVARIVDRCLQVGEHTLEIDLPRDAGFSCTVSSGSETLMTVRRWQRRPFARVEFSADMPEPAIVTLLVLFVLTCDHGTVYRANTG